MIPGHACTAYCSDEDHCELLYIGGVEEAGWDSTRVIQHCDAVYMRQYGRRVRMVRAEPAREAPPSDHPLPAGLQYVRLWGTGTAHNPWLVWWREVES